MTRSAPGRSSRAGRTSRPAKARRRLGPATRARGRVATSARVLQPGGGERIAPDGLGSGRVRRLDDRGVGRPIVGLAHVMVPVGRSAAQVSPGATPARARVRHVGPGATPARADIRHVSRGAIPVRARVRLESGPARTRAQRAPASRWDPVSQPAPVSVPQPPTVSALVSVSQPRPRRPQAAVFRLAVPRAPRPELPWAPRSTALIRSASYDSGGATPTPARAPATAAGLAPAALTGRPGSASASKPRRRHRSSHSGTSPSQARTYAARIGRVGREGPLSASFRTSLG